jgi:hypothetical protein
VSTRRGDHQSSAPSRLSPQSRPRGLVPDYWTSAVAAVRARYPALANRTDPGPWPMGRRGGKRGKQTVESRIRQPGVGMGMGWEALWVGRVSDGWAFGETAADSGRATCANGADRDDGCASTLLI